MTTTRRIVGHWTHIDGRPATGVVTFTPSARLTDPTGHRFIVPVGVEAHLDQAGHIAVGLLPTDTAGLTPEPPGPWHWQVVENIDGQPCLTYPLDVPAGGSPIVLTDRP